MPLENGTLIQGTNRLGEKLETSSTGIFPRHVQGEVLGPIPESGVVRDLGRLFVSQGSRVFCSHSLFSWPR